MWGIRTFIAPLLALQAKIRDWHTSRLVGFSAPHRTAFCLYRAILRTTTGMRFPMGSRPMRPPLLRILLSLRPTHLFVWRFVRLYELGCGPQPPS